MVKGGNGAKTSGSADANVEAIGGTNREPKPQVALGLPAKSDLTPPPASRPKRNAPGFDYRHFDCLPARLAPHGQPFRKRQASFRARHGLAELPVTSRAHRLSQYERFEACKKVVFLIGFAHEHGSTG